MSFLLVTYLFMLVVVMLIRASYEDAHPTPTMLTIALVPPMVAVAMGVDATLLMLVLPFITYQCIGIAAVGFRILYSTLVIIPRQHRILDDFQDREGIHTDDPYLPMWFQGHADLEFKSDEYIYRLCCHSPTQRTVEFKRHFMFDHQAGDILWREYAFWPVMLLRRLGVHPFVWIRAVLERLANRRQVMK